MKARTVRLEKNDVLCHEGDVESDLYFIESGELLVCVRKQSQVTAVAQLGAGEYIGELSFFDSLPRGADIVALTDCTLIKLDAQEVRELLPSWLMHLGRAMAQKLRLHDDVIRQRGIKRANVETIRPLSIEEQAHYYKLLAK